VGVRRRCFETMSPSRIIAGLILLCSLVLAGCQSSSKPPEITASLEKIQPLSLAEGRAVVTVRFINENIIPISFAESTHKLYLNGTEVAVIENKSPVGLAPTSTATRDFTVRFTKPDYVQTLAAHPGNVHYRLESVMTMQFGEDRDRIKNQSQGSVTLGSP
jgi:LEA14-like dessication related protein